MSNWIIANLKMNKTYEELIDYANTLKELVNGSKEKIVVCPSYMAIKGVSDAFEGSNVLVGAQNCAAHQEGAYTGEVSVKMLKSVGASAVILGHSERRRYYGETDVFIHEKLKQAISENLTPVVCLVDTDAENVEANLNKQLEVLLKDITSTNIVFAYEPVWAIGTGKAMEPDDAEKVALLIKEIAKKYLGYMPDVLYGGSVDSINVGSFISQKSIDGVLVGTACKNPHEFAKICLNNNN